MLFWQKVLLLVFVFVSYVVLIGVFVVYPKLFCKEYNPFQFYVQNDTTVCMLLRWLLVVYSLLIGIVLILTIIASYIVKNQKVKSPFARMKGQDVAAKKSKVLIFVPAYSENKLELENTIESVVLNDYPPDSKTLCMVIDGRIKGKNNDKYTFQYVFDILKITETNVVSKTRDMAVYAGEYMHMKYIVIIKKTNAGKKDSFLVVQQLLYYANTRQLACKSRMSRQEVDIINAKLLDEFGVNLNEHVYLLMLDTDTKVDASGLRLLSDYLDSNPFVSGVCGETSLANKTENVLVMSQYFEYYITHYTLKSLESVFGDVLVLSGCFALYRISLLVNKELIAEYAKEEHKNIYTANVTQLGEDRHFTNLLLKWYPQFGTKYIESAKCYTDGPTTLDTLICQRRRWTNSQIFCNLMLLSDMPKYNIMKRIRFALILLLELWIVIYMPLMITLGYYYSGVFIYTCLKTGVVDKLTLGLTLALMCIPIVMCILLQKTKMIKYAFVFMITLPIFSIIIPIYSLYKSDDVSWGKTRQITSQPKSSLPTVAQLLMSTPPPPPPLLNTQKEYTVINMTYPQPPKFQKKMCSESRKLFEPNITENIKGSFLAQ